MLLTRFLHRSKMLKRDNCTYLNFLIHNKNYREFEYLLKNGYKIHSWNTIIDNLIIQNRLDLLKKLDTKIVQSHLYTAIENKNYEIFEWLYSLRTKQDEVVLSDNNLLMHCVKYNCVDILEFLFNEINNRSILSNIFQYSIYHYNFEIVEWVGDKGFTFTEEYLKMVKSQKNSLGYIEYLDKHKLYLYNQLCLIEYYMTLKIKANIHLSEI